MWWIPVVVVFSGAALLLDALLDEVEARDVDPNLVDQLVVSFFGVASSGKSSAVKALYGIDRPTSPIPGTTKRVRRFPGCVRVGVTVADTPGLADVNKATAEKALAFINDTDIFVYFINANGGVNSEVVKNLELLREQKRPLLAVINKIDTIAAAGRKAFLSDQLYKLEPLCDHAIAVAVDPHPSISARPMNLAALKRWIRTAVEEHGEALLNEKGLANVRS